MADRYQSRTYASIRTPDAAVLSALATAALATIVVAAGLGLAFCAQRIAVPIPTALCGPHWLAQAALAKTALPATGPVFVCPITVAVVLVAALTSAWACVLLPRERYDVRQILQFIGAVPVRAAALVLTVAALVPVSTMLADLPSRFATIATLAAVLLLFGATWAATAFVTTGARHVLRIIRSAVNRLLAAAILTRDDARRYFVGFGPALAGVDASVFSAGFGLRAPPLRHPITI